MDKNQALKLIEDAKTYHEAQMEKIAIILGGQEVKDITPLAKTECKFGKMFYEHSAFLREILGSLFYDKMENLHDTWHREYRKVYNIVANKKDKGLVSKLFNKSGLSQMEKDKIKLYYSELEVITKELLKVIDSSYRRMQALSDSKFH